MATRNAKRTGGAKTDAKAENQAPEAAAENAAGNVQAAPADEHVLAAGETLTGDGSGEQLPEFGGDQERAAGPAVTGEDGEPGEIPALYIRAARGIESRRRAGHRFDRQGHGIALCALTDDQIDALKADSALIVEECAFPAEPEAEQ